MWSIWWVWLSAGVLLAILEVLAPGFIFLGFAVGAAVVGILLGIGGPIADWLGGSLPNIMMLFAIVSLITWFALRHLVGVQKNQTKTFDEDINDN